MPLADVNDVYTDIMTSVFSTTIAAKAWLATVAVALAVVQVLTGARMYGKISFLPVRYCKPLTAGVIGLNPRLCFDLYWLAAATGERRRQHR